MVKNVTELNRDSKRDSLAPVPENGRMFGLAAYIPFWISSMVVMQLFVVGQTFVPPNGSLNLLQAGIAAVVSGVIVVLMFIYNSKPGIKYGISFIVQARASFGYFGARIATLIRVLPAVFWYGIGSWIGASAASHITETFWGWSSTAIYFVVFVVLQTVLAYYGIQVVKWVNTLLSVVVLGFLIYINVRLLTVGNLEVADSWSGSGDWGLPFYASITAAVGILITGAINNGDIARYLKRGPKFNWIGHIFGIFPTFLLLVFTGILAAIVTGIWDPVEALVSVVDNPLIAVLMLMFIIAAQVTTNLTLNIIPPAMVIMETFNIRWGISAIIVGVLGTVTFPWVLLTSDVFNNFIAYYSAFLGPLLGILLIDFYVVRKGKYRIKSLYSDAEKFNWLGLGSLAIGGVFGIIFLPISWMIAMPIGAFLYWLGYKVIPYYKAELDSENEELENESSVN